MNESSRWKVFLKNESQAPYRVGISAFQMLLEDTADTFQAVVNAFVVAIGSCFRS